MPNGEKTYVHLIDSLLSLNQNLVKVFSPEHGFRGTADAGEAIKDGKDPKTELPVISLYGTNVSNSDLEHLKGLKNLETLVLQKTEVSDQGLAHLKSLKNLRQLFVLETRVTDTGVTELKSALPKVPVFK